jgi:LysM repeat protein
MGKLAGYTIANIQESFDSSINATSYPTEEGLPITDGIQRQPKTFSITGKILGKTSSDAEKIVTALEKKMNAGTIVSYVGRTKAKNVIITDVSGTFDSTVGNGLSVTISLQEIRMATSPFAVKKTKKKQSGKKSKSNTKKTSKKYHKVRPGDTYWGCARKYGTTVKALESMNPWPARDIPIGVNMRIK